MFREPREFPSDGVTCIRCSGASQQNDAIARGEREYTMVVMHDGGHEDAGFGITPARNANLSNDIRESSSSCRALQDMPREDIVGDI